MARAATGGNYANSRQRPDWGTLVLVALLHVAALLGLIRALAPDFTAAAIEQAGSLVTVTLTPPPPQPPPPPTVPPSPRTRPQSEAGAAAPEAPAAQPREVAAPPPMIVLPRISVAPPITATGPADRSGAGERGSGTGAGGEGSGTGGGRSGMGAGSGSGAGTGTGAGAGGVVSGPVKLDGLINDARDFPIPPGGREIRHGHHVIVHMVVGVDGRARDCRVVKPSPDPEADRITCHLAEERFRFRPATDAQGNPVAAPYGWRQDWY